MSYLWNVCHVGTSGNSFYIGKGYLEYGYGWGWIRARMFPVGVPDYGWTLKRTSPRQVGIGGYDPKFRLSLWLCLLLTASVMAMARKRGQGRERPDYGYLAVAACSIFFGYFAVHFMERLLPFELRNWYPEAISLAMAAIIVAPSAMLIRMIEQILRRFHVPPGHCEVCRYNLTGNVSGICPECGTPIAMEDVRHSGDGLPD